MKFKVMSALCFTAAATLAAAVSAHAEWVNRVTDGIMGTRITVELWSEERAKAEVAIDAVLDEMRHIDESMSTYKPTSEVSLVNASAADGQMHSSRRRACASIWAASPRAIRWTAASMS
jgi:thiamine biosynthesis lipoprotein ApbE